MNEHNDASENGPWEKAREEALFEGDCGTLSYGQRKALTALVKLRYVSSLQEPETWLEVERSESELAPVLNNLFLDLVVDRRYDVAYAVQASTGSDQPFPNALKPATSLKRDQTVLLLYLRTFYHKQTASGEANVFVDRSDLVDALEKLDAEKEVNHVAAAARVDKVIDDFVGKHEYLFKVKEQKDRYRVSPIVAAMLPLERVKELNDEFERILDER